MRTNAMVVDAGCFDPSSNWSHKLPEGAGTSTWVTLRSGTNPPSAWRRANMYWISLESFPG